jgi:hypothetical protein
VYELGEATAKAILNSMGFIGIGIGIGIGIAFGFCSVSDN